MGKIRYTVTTITKRCPYCGKTVDTETHGEFTPFLGILFLFTFPVFIPYLLIRYLALKDPTFPKIGPKSFPCPHCSLPILTNNHAVEDLDGKDLFLHKFKKWIYISYVIGGVFGICVFIMIIGEPVISLFGLFALLSLIGVVTIIITYHIKLEEITNSKPKVTEQPKPTVPTQKSIAKNGDISFIYCRKCGNKLPSDSQFCSKCGTEIVK